MIYEHRISNVKFEDDGLPYLLDLNGAMNFDFDLYDDLVKSLTAGLDNLVEPDKTNMMATIGVLKERYLIWQKQKALQEEIILAVQDTPNILRSREIGSEAIL